MAKVSIIIPSKDDRFLNKTIQNLTEQAVGEYEIIVVLDGLTSYLPFVHPQVKYITKQNPEGLRKAINLAAAVATGEYLLKTDAHCMFDKGFDEVLQKDCEENWVIIPRRYGMDPNTPETWERQRNFFDYYYLTSPWESKRGLFLNTKPWVSRTEERAGIKIDETMSTHGSVWFMTRKYFFDGLEGLEEEKFGLWGENEEIALKTWLGGGRMLVNKNTWYAHLQMRAETPLQREKDNQAAESHKKLAEYWTRNLWEKRKHDFDWLVERFWPLPTEAKHHHKERYLWVNNWKELYFEQNGTNILSHFAYKYGSDKCPQIKHHYTDTYYKLFKDKRELVKKVIEIGVGSPEAMGNYPNYKIGASLYMWRDFFPNAQIYGADVKGELVFKDRRIETFQCDQGNTEDLINLIKQTGTDIDLFIDDGSHNPREQVFTCKTIMPMLMRDAIYVIEDVADLGILDQLKEFDCNYKRFRSKSSWNDRMIVIRHKPKPAKKSDKVSFIIPSRNETYTVESGETVLARTVRDIYEKCSGDFEVLVSFDGPPYQKLPDYPNLRTFELPEALGLKHALNLLSHKAKGKYLFKLDSHCMISPNIDEVLKAQMEENWIVTPRFYVLNAEEWKWQDNKFYDYFFLPCPFTDRRMFRFQAGGHWEARTQQRLHIPVEENMKLHGSAFFVHRKFLTETLGGIAEGWIDPSSGEDIELSLKTWLGPWGGKLMVNKKCWYAHMHKGGQRPRGWEFSEKQIADAYLKIANYWMSDVWEQRARDLEWLVERFMPVPTWPDDWRQRWLEWKQKNK